MDEARRTALRATLEELVRDRERLDGAISLLMEKLGMGPVLLPNESGSASEGTELRDVGPVAVGDGEFYGMSQTKAARAFLERAGRSRPQKTDEILAALTKGGVHVGGKDPSGLLYRLMLRDKSFRRVGTSLWGLDSWYPPLPRKPEKVFREADHPEPEQEGAHDGDASDGAREPEGTMPPT